MIDPVRRLKENPMKSISVMSSLAFLLLAGTGCSSRGDAVGSTERVSTGGSSASRLVGTSFEKDGPTAAWAAALAMKATPPGVSAAVQFPVYRLGVPQDPVLRMAQRSAALGISPSKSSSYGSALTRSDGDFDLVIDSKNEMEVWVNRARHHSGTVADVGTLKSEGEYLSLASQYVAQKIDSPAGLTLHPYKFWKYYHELWAAPGVREEQRAYEVVVIFNSYIGEVPVVGSGGKVAVYMGLGGDVVSHTSYLRGPRSQVGTASLASLLSTQEAEARAITQLSARGMDPTRFTVTRREFGYWVTGRMGAQKYLAPHYVFAFTPTREGESGVGEHVLAVSDPALVKLLS
jgi:hypothetical protein